MAEKQLSPDRRKELEEMFNNFDKDGDGKITFSELKTALELIGDFKSDKEIHKMIEEVDVDKNGTIEFNEFVVYFDNNIGTMQTRRDEMESIFKVFDINNDGFVTFEELETVFKRMGENVTPDEISGLIKRVDLNQDGKLDFKEFAKLWKSLNSK